MMRTVEPIRYGPGPNSTELWGGPLDGQAVQIDHLAQPEYWPDVCIPIRPAAMPGTDTPDNLRSNAVAVYVWNTDRTRYEYSPTRSTR